MSGAWQRESVSSTPGSVICQQHLAESASPTVNTTIKLRKLEHSNEDPTDQKL